MRKQLPDSWNRWDAIEVAEELIRKEKSYHNGYYKIRGAKYN